MLRDTTLREQRPARSSRNAIDGTVDIVKSSTSSTPEEAVTSTPIPPDLRPTSPVTTALKAQPPKLTLSEGRRDAISQQPVDGPAKDVVMNSASSTPIDEVMKRRQ